MKRDLEQKKKGFTHTPRFGVAPKGGGFTHTPKLVYGFTLVEVLVSISIFTMSILGLMTILSQGIVDIGYAKKKIMAGYLAQEGIEYVRNMRDTHVLYTALTGNDWNSFKNANKSYPIADSDFTGFSRTITMTSVGSNEVKISSTVTWTQGSGPQSVTLSENLFNWWQ